MNTTVYNNLTNGKTTSERSGLFSNVLVPSMLFCHLTGKKVSEFVKKKKQNGISN